MEKERKQQIIKAAIKRFVKHGLKKTTLDEVARDLRIGKATIYHYFRSKEELYFDCLKYESALFSSEIKGIFENDELPPLQKFNDYFLLKENFRDKFKLLYILFIEELKGSIFDDEKELLKEFVSGEIEIINKALSKTKQKRDKNEIKEISFLIVKLSLSLIFSSQLVNPDQSEIATVQSSLLMKIIEPLLQ